MEGRDCTVVVTMLLLLLQYNTHCNDAKAKRLTWLSSQVNVVTTIVVYPLLSLKMSLIQRRLAVARVANHFKPQMATPCRDMSTETYSERQAKKGRPVSPHVTIYKFPVVALSSITNRVTGVALSAGFTGIGLLSLGNVDVPSLMTTIGNVFLVGSVAKMAVTFPVAFHYFGGIRHIFWDKTPEALQNDQVESSSYAVLGASVAVTAIAGLLL